MTTHSQTIEQKYFELQTFQVAKDVQKNPPVQGILAYVHPIYDSWR